MAVIFGPERGKGLNEGGDMKKSKLVLAIAMLVFVILASGPNVLLLPAGAVEKKVPATKTSAKQSWEAGWDKTLMGAKKEGRELVIYTTTGPQVRSAYAKAMKQLYLPRWLKERGFALTMLFISYRR